MESIQQSDENPQQATPQSPSSSSIPIIFDSALKQYAEKTGVDLTTHALTAKLGRCNTVDAVIGVFQDQLYTLKKLRNRQGRRAKIIEAVKPVVGVVLPLLDSGILDKCLGAAFPPAQAVLAGIGILLQTVKKVEENYETLVELFEKIKGFLARLKIYDRVSLPSAMLEAIVKIVAEMLSIFALATKEVKQGSLKKFGKTLLQDKAIQDALEHMDKLTQEETRAVVAETYGNTVAIMGDTQQILSNQSTQQRAELRHRYQTWLNPPDSSTNQNFASDRHHIGTSSWFLEGRVFEEWRKTGSVMWIHGKPGSGKSILCSTIIKELERLHAGERSSTVAYFYFDFRDSKKQAFHGMLASLIVQLSVVSDTLCDVISHMYSAHGDGLRQPGEGALAQCLLDMLSASGQGTRYVILDALDECPHNRVSPPRHKILNFLVQMSSQCPSDLRVCIMSRPEDDIADTLRPLALHRVCLEDESDHALDMEHYIRHEVNTNVRMRKWPEKTRNLVIETLSKNANGMFRYVACQLDILRNCPPATVEITLQTLPKTLYETYESTLRRIEDDSEENWRHAHRIFQCLSFSVRPLRVEELAEVLAIDFDQSIPALNPDWRSESPEEAVLSTCPGSFIAIVINEGGHRIVQFAHFSVKEFLTSNHLAKSSDPDVSRFYVLSGVAHTVLAQACLATLLQLHSSVNMSSVGSYPLSIYAAGHWDTHAQPDDAIDYINDAVDILFGPQSPHLAAWIWVHDKNKPWLSPSLQLADGPEDPSATLLFYAALCGLADLVLRISTSQPERVDMMSAGRHGTVLQAAANSENLDTVQALLDYGTLQAASAWGHLEIVRLLLDRGADVNAWGGSHWTALEAASAEGHLEIVCLLLDYGADLNMLGGGRRTTLEVASAKGHLEIVCLLHDYGADLNMWDGVHGTMLEAASAEEHLEIVRLLLNRGADVNALGGIHGTALQAASVKGHLEIVRLLLSRRAGVNAWGGSHGTALQAASVKGHLEIVRLLLNHGVDVNALGGSHGTALQAASAKGHLEIVRLLLNRGADVNALGGIHGTALQAASVKGHLEIVRLLLNRGADVNADPCAVHGGPFASALVAASFEGNMKIVQTLLDWGADVDPQAKADLMSSPPVSTPSPTDASAEDAEYTTPLAAASACDKFQLGLDIAQLLLERGANVNARGSVDGTALAVASYWGNGELVRLLLDHGANVNDEGDGAYGNALQAASFGGEFAIVQLLLDRGADINARGTSVAESALEIASAEGYEGIVDLLSSMAQTDAVLAIGD